MPDFVGSLPGAAVGLAALVYAVIENRRRRRAEDRLEQLNYHPEITIAIGGSFSLSVMTVDIYVSNSGPNAAIARDLHAGFRRNDHEAAAPERRAALAPGDPAFHAATSLPPTEYGSIDRDNQLRGVVAWVQYEDRLGALWKTTADIGSHHQTVQLHKAKRS